MFAVGPMQMGSVGLRRLIDGLTLGLLAATFARLADHEVLLQALWVTAGIGAVIYGLAAATARILAVAVAALAYTIVAVSLQDPVEPNALEFPDLIEWSLMVGIGILVAFLADRIGTSARHYAALYREASQRLLTAQEQERGRLARNLHDSVGQTLTAVILTLERAQSQLATGAGPGVGQAGSAISRAQSLASSALDEVRDVAAQLRPARIHDIGLGAALVNLASEAGVAVEVRLDAALLPAGLLPDDAEIDAYRIVQEAIGNAARHSGAKTIWIDGDATADGIRLEVGDDGSGLDPSAWSRGLGLAGMEERATILGAHLDIRSRPGHGTIVSLSIPRPPAPTDLGRPTPALAGESPAT